MELIIGIITAVVMVSGFLAEKLINRSFEKAKLKVAAPPHATSEQFRDSANAKFPLIDARNRRLESLALTAFIAIGIIQLLTIYSASRARDAAGETEAKRIMSDTTDTQTKITDLERRVDNIEIYLWGRKDRGPDGPPPPSPGPDGLHGLVLKLDHRTDDASTAIKSLSETVDRFGERMEAELEAMRKVPSSTQPGHKERVPAGVD